MPLTPLLLFALKEAPGIIAALRATFRKHHPTDPVPSDDEIIAAFNEAYASSKARDEKWLAEHPER